MKNMKYSYEWTAVVMKKTGNKAETRLSLESNVI